MPQLYLLQYCTIDAVMSENFRFHQFTMLYDENVMFCQLHHALHLNICVEHWLHNLKVKIKQYNQTDDPSRPQFPSRS